MTDNRGFHSKIRRKGKLGFSFKGSSDIMTPDRRDLLVKWQSMTAQEREKYGFSFEKFSETKATP